MFIDANQRIAARGSEGRDAIRMGFVRLSLAPPNRVGGLPKLRAINISRPTGVKAVVS